MFEIVGVILVFLIGVWAFVGSLYSAWFTNALGGYLDPAEKIILTLIFVFGCSMMYFSGSFVLEHLSWK